MNKQTLLDLAEVSDAHRLRESVALAGYGIFVVYVVLRIMEFYFNLPPDRQDSLPIAGFCAAVFTVVTGFSAPLFTTFNNSKRQWPVSPPAPSVTVESRSTSVGVPPP